MMNICEQIQFSWRYIDLETVQPVIEQVEGPDPALEKCAVRLMVKRDDRHFGRLILMRLLHHLFILKREPGLKIRMSVNRPDYGV